MRRSALIVFGSLLLVAGFAGAGAAQEKPDAAAVSALSGEYQLNNADGDRTCPMTLKPDAAPGGAFAIGFDKAACADAIAFTGSVAAWSPGPGVTILLLGPQQRLVAEFTEGVGGSWETLREDDGVYFLVNTKLADQTQQVQPADMFGAWNLARVAGKNPCRVTLSETQTEDGGYKLDLAAGCDATLARFVPTSWRMERGDLVFISPKGDRLRFALQEEGGWAKVPESNRPLSLTRP